MLIFGFAPPQGSKSLPSSSNIISKNRCAVNFVEAQSRICRWRSARPPALAAENSNHDAPKLAANGSECPIHGHRSKLHRRSRDYARRARDATALHRPSLYTALVEALDVHCRAALGQTQPGPLLPRRRCQPLEDIFLYSLEVYKPAESKTVFQS